MTDLPIWLQDAEQPNLSLGLYYYSSDDGPCPMDIDGEMDELINMFSSISLNDEPPESSISLASHGDPMDLTWSFGEPEPSPMDWEPPPAFQMDWELTITSYSDEFDTSCQQTTLNAYLLGPQDDVPIPMDITWVK